MKWGSDHLHLICGKRSVRIVKILKFGGDNDEYPFSSRLETDVRIGPGGNVTLPRLRGSVTKAHVNGLYAQMTSHEKSVKPPGQYDM